LQTDVLFGVVKRAMDARRIGDGGKNKNESNDGDNETKDDLIRRRMRERAQEWGLPPLKALVMSATLDINTFQSFFADAAMVKIPGRQFPVQIVYTKEPQEVSSLTNRFPCRLDCFCFVLTVVIILFVHRIIFIPRFPRRYKSMKRATRVIY
jgi:HrpA-like RNA helicase